MMRDVTCPFCGERNLARWHLNVLCTCGAKFYIHTYEWWDRKSGKRIKATPTTCGDCACCTYLHEYETHWCTKEKMPVRFNDHACHGFEMHMEE